MGNFEKLSVLVIVVIIVMILVVALYTWTDNPDHASGGANTTATSAETSQQPPVAPSMSAGGMDGIVIPSATLAKPDGKDKTTASTGPRSINDLLDEMNRTNVKPAPAPLPDVPPPAPAAPAAPRTYTIQAGDSLSRIAKREYPKSPQQGLAAILQANPKVVPERMREKDVLVLPELGPELAVGGNTTPMPPSTPVRPTAGTISRGGEYVVKKGDTLASISKRAYGTTDKWQDIWLTNFDVIEDVDHPMPGTRLKISR